MSNDKLYGRCFVPHYALFKSVEFPVMDMEYAPWILLHADRKMLTDEILMEEWRHFYCKNDDDVLDEFYDMLKQKGYMTAYMEEPILVLDVT